MFHLAVVTITTFYVNLRYHLPNHMSVPGSTRVVWKTLQESEPLDKHTIIPSTYVPQRGLV